MSTTASTPRLSEVARHLVIPDGIKTSVHHRIKPRLAAMGVHYDPWQEGAATVALGCRADGKFAATVGGVVWSIPRQVGKTYTVGNLLIALAIEIPGIRIVWTSHHGRTTTNTFRSMQGMVKRKQIRPFMPAGGGVRTANGEQEIRFANGSLILFGAREHGFGRGMDAVDILVFDEAQILDIKALEDMVPATNQARNPHGGLVFFIGTPPRPTDNGEAFRAKRRRALSGESNDIFYVEMGADPDADLDDRDQWAKANPSYPLRTPLESMLRMRENIPDDASWGREAMGKWDEVAEVQRVIPSDIWNALAAGSEAPAQDAPPSALAVDMSHDRVISIDGCWLTEHSCHVEILALDAAPNSSTAVEWLVERAGRKIPVVIDSYSPAASMIPTLKARGVRVVVTNANDMSKACGGFFDDALAGRLTHADQKQLNDALAGASRRKIGDAGGWGWDRRDPTVNISPLVSATLARFGATVTTKKPTAAFAF